MKKIDLKADEVLIKQALSVNPEAIKNVLRPIIAATGVAGAAGLYGYYQGKQNEKRHKDDLAKSMAATFSMDSRFQKSPDRFSTLFGELSVMAPTVAKNPNLANKLISQRLGKGFDLDDVHKLSVIESSGGASRTLPTPRAAAGAAAASALEKLITVIGPYEYKPFIQGVEGVVAPLRDRVQSQEDRTKHEAEVLANAQEEIQKTPPGAARFRALRDAYQGPKKDDPGHKKEGSEGELSLFVSDVCMGRMLSDRVTLIKQAAPDPYKRSAAAMESVIANSTTKVLRDPTFKESWSKGVAMLKDHMGTIMPALVLGGGMGLVKLVHDKLQDHAVHQKADANFERLRRTSDVVKGNPEIAQEAYETLKMVAPVLATRPGVLKEYIEGQAMAGRLPNYEQVRALAEAGQSVERKGSNRGFMSGVKDTLELTRLPLKSKYERKEEVYDKPLDPFKNV